jgi:DNA-binding FrmR family transcriptional regulator
LVLEETEAAVEEDEYCDDVLLKAVACAGRGAGVEAVARVRLIFASLRISNRPE